MTQQKTFAQQKRIFGLCKRLGLDDDTRRGAVAVVTTGRTDSVGQLTFDEANALIVHLGGDPLDSRTVPRRTRSYHRQQAGIKQIAQPAHLRLMRDLAAGRGITEEGLRRMGERMLKHWPPHTTAETNKIIEALKSMNRRDAERRAA